MHREEIAIRAAIEAGKAIMFVYDTPFGVEYKQDQSPLTKADRLANEIIMSYLSKTDFPIISEENAQIPYAQRRDWQQLWMVDPLDGTKEFIKKNDEFTVNIAFIENGNPKEGVIYAPALRKLYYTLEGKAYRQSDVYAIEDWSVEKSDVLPQEETNDGEWVMLVSRSHMSAETADFVEGQKSLYPDKKITMLSAGSSLKICKVVEGSANIYPRFAPTMEWDVAAGHAIAQAAYCEIIDVKKGQTLEYNKENLLNPWFILQKIKS
ncbi:MAG: 3'(2'),5'-bisphosphate nucleotidase CysQ [Weeksellaceae bacterium]|nr:3'(2'),5'-bisphosphate nucleotidase CysQ [Weeksellaceae bacterium]